jgi:hypothetical protein
VRPFAVNSSSQARFDVQAAARTSQMSRLRGDSFSPVILGLRIPPGGP